MVMDNWVYWWLLLTANLMVPIILILKWSVVDRVDYLLITLREDGNEFSMVTDKSLGECIASLPTDRVMVLGCWPISQKEYKAIKAGGYLK